MNSGRPQRLPSGRTVAGSPPGRDKAVAAAVHAGHLDAARELLEGRTWLGPENSRIARD